MKITEFVIIFNGNKKFITKDIKEINIIPHIILFSKYFFSETLKSFFFRINRHPDKKIEIM